LYLYQVPWDVLILMIICIHSYLLIVAKSQHSRSKVYRFKPNSLISFFNSATFSSDLWRSECTQHSRNKVYRFIPLDGSMHEHMYLYLLHVLIHYKLLISILSSLLIIITEWQHSRNKVYPFIPLDRSIDNCCLHHDFINHM
jgi:hypothetical protein